MDTRVAEFLTFLTVEKNASENTISAYRSDLDQFEKSVARQSSTAAASWDAITDEMLLTFVEELRGRDYKAATVARKVAAVKSFFSFMAAEGILPCDPTEELRSPQVGKALPRTLTPEEVDELLEQPARKSTAVAQRDKAMLELAYHTGMRVTELVSLDVAHVALESDPVTVRSIGKGDQERALPLHQRAVDELRQYIFHVRPKMVRNRNETALFVNRRGGRLTRQGFWLILKNYAREARLDGITPHTLRHTYATHMLSGGMPLRNVQEALGHASISTTQIYTQLTDQQRREQYDKAHPRA
ncbi:MAG: tyrosine recombinase [Dehalococcoidia bacterium]|nr:tyrosine recombinase [Dehalococcoidia bacterium]HCV00326.1 tyrosine recombinase XerD [Dehalococcoidia bacterium]|tara:strand:+ start:1210 stop:2112 length:903 start_codon:yes stop_codon:yes gene_type:complete